MTLQTPIQVKLPDGADIQTWVCPGHGVPLLFLYGLGCSIAHWKYQIRHFQGVGRLTVHLDYRGHGQSSVGHPERPLTIKSLSEDVSQVLTLLKIDQAIVFGQSMGGSIALQLAHDHPNQVTSLVLQGSPGREPFSKMRAGRGSAEKILKALTALNRKSPRSTRILNSLAAKIPMIAREIVRLQGFNKHLASTDDIDEYVRNFFSSDPNIFYELAEDMMVFNVSKFSDSIACPTLILAGAKDQVVPVEELRWLAKRLPASELEIFPHGSHCPHLEDPMHVNRRIDTFMTTYGL